MTIEELRAIGQMAEAKLIGVYELYSLGDPPILTPGIVEAVLEAAVWEWLEAQPDAPEPDWTQAPPWAQWWAVDANGMAWWYATQPEYLSGDGTDWDCGQQARRVGEIDLPLGIDWRTTLRTRPQS